MYDFNKMIARQRKWMLYFLAATLLGYVLLPYPRVFLGLFLGGIISFYSLWLLQSKTKALGEAFAAGVAPRLGIGTFSRIAAAVFAILIALRFQEHFHLVAVIIGIVSSYLIMAVDLLFRVIRQMVTGDEQ